VAPAKTCKKQKKNKSEHFGNKKSKCDAQNHYNKYGKQVIAQKKVRMQKKCNQTYK